MRVLIYGMYHTTILLPIANCSKCESFRATNGRNSLNALMHGANRQKRIQPSTKPITNGKDWDPSSNLSKNAMHGRSIRGCQNKTKRHRQ